MVLARYRADLLEDVYREFSNNCLWVNIDNSYRESKYFKETVIYFVFNICELNPMDKIGNIIHEFLKTPFFENPEHCRGIYRQIRYEILPVLWKNHRVIEQKKQGKLTFLANELHGAGRIVEAHIVRTIVKPYIRNMNKKWSKMTALEKLKAVVPLLTSSLNQILNTSS